VDELPFQIKLSPSCPSFPSAPPPASQDENAIAKQSSAAAPIRTKEFLRFIKSSKELFLPRRTPSGFARINSHSNAAVPKRALWRQFWNGSFV
jgi:hypothetical protein